MVYRKNQRKKSLMFCITCVILFIIGITAGVSFAYFSDSAKAENTLNFGKLRIQTGSNEKVAVTLTGNATTSGKLAPTDTVTIEGSVELEEGSVPAYIRIKAEIEDQNGNKIAGAFKTGLMSQIGEIIDTTGNKRWFVVGRYLYLGNEIKSDSPFSFNGNNTNPNDAIAIKNNIKMTSEMLANDIEGNQIKITFIFQAIQSAGMSAGVTGSDYTEGNAKNISSIPAWEEIFGVDLNEVYDDAWKYTMGTFTQTMEAEAQMAGYGTFKPSEGNNSGDYIQFGWYPQTIKASDVKITNATAKFAGFECYVGDDKCLYVKVANPTPYNSGNSCTYSGGTACSKTTELFFKLERIVWQILSDESGNKLLYSVKELTAMQYFESNGNNATRTITGESNGVYNNNYKYSYVRAYLNGITTYNSNNNVNNDYLENGLLQQAFTKTQSNLIKPTTVDNSAKTSNSQSNPYFCSNTSDKIFLLSYADLSGVYRTKISNGSGASTLIKFPTDYAGAKGALRSAKGEGGGDYWSRSPLSNNSSNACYVYRTNNVYDTGVNNAYLGVVPALYLSI